MTRSDEPITVYGVDLYSEDPVRRERAVERLWLIFSDRMAGVIRSRVNPQLLRRAGVEDILQSVWMDLIDSRLAPKRPPRNREELWGLLVRITMCKISNAVAFHTSGKRDYRKESPLDPAGGLSSGFRGLNEPDDGRRLSPIDESIARELFDSILNELPEDLRRIFQLRVLGHTNRDIAEIVGRVERTVELKMKTIRSIVKKRLEFNDVD